MDNFWAFVVFVIAWVSCGYALERFAIKSQRLCMVVGAILGMLMAYYFAYFGS